MKTVIFFDVDNTIYNNFDGAIPSQTKKLLEALASKDDVVLGLATGRGLAKLDIISDVLHLFTYKVLINGSVVYKNEDVLYEHPIQNEDIEEIIKLTKSNAYNIGMVGLNDEAVNYWDDRVGYGMKALRGIFPKVDPEFYLKNKIYQLWMFADNEEKILDIAKQTSKFSVYPWHVGGADFIYPYINKAYGIQKALEHEIYDRLICIGDGLNDMKMIEMADIGIVMSNTRFIALKEKADHMAPHIREDQLYAFFQSLGLI
ncbi:MAG: HAD family phosphatase [Acholeplasmataceae bacterium]|nr:HAD family phosphatase [Acholeplasmataceae bacterium]